MPLIAQKSFLDGKGRLITVGDELPGDYDEPTLAHYSRLGLAAEGKAHRESRKIAGSSKASEIKVTEGIAQGKATTESNVTDALLLQDSHVSEG